MRHLCCAAYVIALETIERRQQNRILAALIADSMSESRIEIPDPDEARDRFDQWLRSEPEKRRYDPQRDALELALGIR